MITLSNSSNIIHNTTVNLKLFECTHQYIDHFEMSTFGMYALFTRHCICYYVLSNSIGFCKKTYVEI